MQTKYQQEKQRRHTHKQAYLSQGRESFKQKTIIKCYQLTQLTFTQRILFYPYFFDVCVAQTTTNSWRTALCLLRNNILHHMQSLQVCLSCVNRMRNILTTGVYSDYTKTRVGTSDFFFSDRTLHPYGEKRNEKHAKIQWVCRPGVFTAQRWQLERGQSTEAIHRGKYAHKPGHHRCT
jgi:hypothetical protein